jgi:hypothetical protein
MSAFRDVFLMKATRLCAKRPFITPEMLEVQFDQLRILGISHEVMGSSRWLPAHAVNGISNFCGQLRDMLGIPGIIVSDLATAGECERRLPSAD